MKQLLHISFLLCFTFFGAYGQTLNEAAIATNVNGIIYTMAQDSTTIYFGGAFDTVGNKTNGLAKINAGGQIVTNFNGLSNGSDAYVSISDGAGGWYVGGLMTNQGLDNIVHILADNRNDLGFDPNPNGIVRALCLVGGVLYIGGDFTSIAGQPIKYLAAVDATTGDLINWNPAPNASVRTIIESNSLLYVGGDFDSIGGKQYKRIAAVNLGSAEVLPFFSVDNSVYTLQQDAANLYAGGSFVKAGYYSGVSALLNSSSDKPDFNFPKITGTVVSSISDNSGGWYLGGNFTVGALSNLVHILPDLSIDLTFTPNPNSEVSAMQLDNGVLYLGGQFTQIAGQPKNYLAAFDAASGTLLPWIPDAGNNVYTLFKSGDVLYIGGSFATVGGQPRNKIASVDAINGQVSAWNPGANSTVYKIKVESGKILVGGNFTNIAGVSHRYLASFSESSGILDAWNPNANAAVKCMATNGQNVYIGGDFTTIGGQARKYIAEIDLTTGLATSWNPNPNQRVYAISFSDNVVYAGGNFTIIAGLPRGGIAALNPIDGTAFPWNPMSDGDINTITMNAGSIFIGGNFEYVNTVSRSKFMAIRKSDMTITSLNPDLNAYLAAIELNGDKAYLGGNFTTVGGQPRNRIAEISLETGLATPWDPNANAAVNAIKVMGNKVYTAGLFNNIGGLPHGFLVALSSSTGEVVWDGKADYLVRNMTKFNNEITVTGKFAFTNTERRNSAFAISKATGLITPWNPDTPGRVYTIALSPTSAYLGGTFSEMGGLPRNKIAEVDLITGLPTAWNPNAGSIVNDIKFSGSTVYAAGSFTTMGGLPRTYLAAINSVDGAVLPWNPVVENSVEKIAVSEGVLYAVGYFETINGQSRKGIAALNTTDGSLTPWNPVVTGGLVCEIKATASEVYIGGVFTQVNGQTRYNIASFEKATGLLTPWKPKVQGTLGYGVKTIVPSGNKIFIGGNFTSVAGLTCKNFAILNPLNAFPEHYFPTVDQTIYAFLTTKNLLFIGGQFSHVLGNRLDGLAMISYGDNIFQEAVYNFTPVKGGNIGEVTLTVNGYGFNDGTVVKLKKEGQPDIVLQSAHNLDGIQITGTLSLREAVVGSWDVSVEIPGLAPVVIPAGFEVEEGIAAEPWVAINASTPIRVGQWKSCKLVYGNKGNVDAHGVPLWFTVSDNAELDLKFKITKVYELNGLPYAPVYDEIEPFFAADTVMDVVGAVKLVGIYLPVIKAGSTNSLSFSVKLSSFGSIKMMSWADPPYFGSPVRPWVSPCWDAVFDFILNNGGPLLACTNSLFNTYYQMTEYGNEIQNENFSGNNLNIAYDTSSILASNLLNCAGSVLPPNVRRKAKAAMKFLDKSLSTRKTGHPNSLFSCLEPLSLLLHKPIQAVTPVDPNEKYGLEGYGTGQYISTIKTLPYTIKCENLATATAAAQNVRITDLIDSSVLDLDTFELGAITVGDTIIALPPGLKSYETDIDLRPANNIIAHLKANLNRLTGLASWEFSSLDPITLLPTEEVLDGFLPPNVNQPQGEASVSYTIKPKAALPVNTEIKNKADIYFDTNAPITTNEWLNTTDDIKPVSAAFPTPLVQNQQEVTVSWSGSDLGSGIATYDLYYAVNGGAFALLASSITELSYTFTADGENVYSFFTIATDNVGNVEPMKNIAEATVDLSTLSVVDLNNSNNFTIYPNPNAGNFNIAIKSTDARAVHVAIYDVLGREVFSNENKILAGINDIPVHLDNAGVYIVTVGADDFKNVGRVIVQSAPR